MARKPKDPDRPPRREKRTLPPAPPPADPPQGLAGRSLAEMILRPPREGTLARAARAAAAMPPAADRRAASPAGSGTPLRTPVEREDLAGGRRRPDLVLDPGRIGRPPLASAEAPPLLLLPLRLEYRFVVRGAELEVRDTRALVERLTKLEAEAATAGKKRRAQIAQEIAKVRDASLRVPFKRAAPAMQAAEELWLRWYPDEGFAEEGIAPPTPEEATALKAFDARAGGRPWWDVADPEVAPAWQDLARAVGPARAVHLQRSAGEPSDPDFQRRIGRIAALPESVSVFALFGNGVTRLVTGAPIPPNAAERSKVSYTPEAIEAGGWIADFEAALAAGMGAKVTELELVRLAKEASWIIAVGLSKADGGGEVEALLRSRIANGGFGVLPQDTPTNNSAGSTSHHTDPLSDVAGFARRATALERGAYAPGLRTAADLLAQAFAIDAGVVRRALDGADLGYEDARAMLRVIGPALLDDGLDGVTHVSGVDENRFIDVMAAAVVARGVLPALRFGNNAFGVLPMTRIADLDLGKDEDERGVQSFLRFYAAVARAFLPGHAERVVPVIAPGDREASDKLAEILKTNRVSTRVDVADEGAARIRAVTCPYIVGTEPEHAPQAYLKALRFAPVRELPDPNAEDRSWPLLYRLARVTLTRNSALPVVDGLIELPSRSVGWLERLTVDERERTARLVARVLEFPAAALAAEGGPVGELPDVVIERIKVLNAEFDRALGHLEAVAARPQGAAELEVLMMEVLDLFQHRVDAFAVGLAYARLRRIRDGAKTGLAAGYYGFLGRLRPESATGGSDGYIQAPSTPQAVTAAVLRSAFLRHRGDGAFAIDHGSRRVRQALRLMDLLSKGHSLGEGLGMRGERILHERRLDRFIRPLRLRFPVPDQRGETGAARRMFDGRAFLASAIPPVEPELAALQLALRDEFDALADIVVAEAVHQRALGLGEAANAWLQVLSGHPPPGAPVFLRTQRHGQASTHRLLALIAAVDPDPDDGGPRELAEPALAALAAEALAGFGGAVARLRPAQTAPGQPPGSVDVRLAADLGMRPIDLVVGGASEVVARARRFLLERMLRDPAVLAGLNAAGDLADFASGRASLAVDLDAGTPSVSALAAIAEAIRAAVQRGRPMEPGDLNAAAPAAAGLLSEADGVAMAEHALGALRGRAQALRDRLGPALAALGTRIATFETDLNELLRAVAAGEPDAAVAQKLALAEAARRALSDALERVAAFGEPGALRVFALNEAIQQPAATLERMRGVEARLAGRRKVLAATLAGPAGGFGTLAVVTAAADATAAAIRDALDGAATPLLPPLPRSLAAARPVLGPAAPPGQLLGGWATVRAGAARAGALAAVMPGVAARPVAAAATADDTAPGTPTRGRRPRRRGRCTSGSYSASRRRSRPRARSPGSSATSGPRPGRVPPRWPRSRSTTTARRASRRTACCWRCRRTTSSSPGTKRRRRTWSPRPSPG